MPNRMHPQRSANVSRPSAPSMPTERQIQEAHKAVAAICPSARIFRVGPEGVEFEYPDGSTSTSGWEGRPFSAEAG